MQRTRKVEGGEQPSEVRDLVERATTWCSFVVLLPLYLFISPCSSFIDLSIVHLRAPPTGENKRKEGNRNERYFALLNDASR